VGAVVVAFFTLRKKEAIALGPSPVQKKAEEEAHKAIDKAERVHEDALAEALKPLGLEW
jgi:hypothetical protein